jgi:hypothetical protein
MISFKVSKADVLEMRVELINYYNLDDTQKNELLKSIDDWETMIKNEEKENDKTEGDLNVTNGNFQISTKISEDDNKYIDIDEEEENK